MFNQKLKQEISALQAQLQALTAQESAVSRAMAMIRFDRDGKVVNANPLFQQTMGYSLADLQGKPHSQLCFPDYANSADYRAFWDRLRRGEPFSDGAPPHCRRPGNLAGSHLLSGARCSGPN